MLRIYPTPPFRLGQTLQPLLDGARNSVNRWDGKTFRRVFVRKNRPAELSITQEVLQDRPALIMDVRGLSLGAENKVALLPTLSHMLGLGLQLETFLHKADSDPRLQQLVAGAESMKPSRFATAFEALTNAFSMEHAQDGHSCFHRFVEAFGVRFEDHPAFPRPQDLVGKAVEDITILGFSTAQSATLLDLATRLHTAQLDFKTWHDLDNATVIARLQNLFEINRSAAEYTTLMGFGRTDVFPTHNQKVLQALAQWLDLAEIPDPETIPALLAPWSPYRGMIYFHLLRRVQPVIEP